jgi:hypothetical protein
MNGFVFTGANLKKENQIAAFFKKWVGWEVVFHFFHLVFHFLPHLLKGEKNICHLRQKKSYFF